MITSTLARRSDVVPASVPIQHIQGRIQPVLLTVRILNYGGHPRDVAAQQVWEDWSRRYPFAIIQVVHADDPNWEIAPSLEVQG